MKNFIRRFFAPLLGPRRHGSTGIDRLRPTVATVDLPGPFDHATALAYFSHDAFHQKSRRTAMATLIHLLKHHQSREAADRLARLVTDYIKAHPLSYQPDLMVTIPDSVIGRPFSPTAYVAEVIARHFSWQARHDIICRLGSETPQKDRGFAERRGDTRRRYAVLHGDLITGKHILLFDDIYATGRSLIEAADLLREHAPISVAALTLVRLGPPDS